MFRIASLARFSLLALAVIGTLGFALLAAFVSVWMVIPALVFAGLSLVGLHDITQTQHAVLRNYPIIGHVRYMLESIRPEIRQYLLEGTHDEEPFSREARSLVYQRAKGVEDKRPFGTTQKVYEAGYAWITHSVVPRQITNTDFRVRIGNDSCKQPYDASLYNISAMSFGSLSGNAISALNMGAKLGGFAHDLSELERLRRRRDLSELERLRQRLKLRRRCSSS